MRSTLVLAIVAAGSVSALERGNASWGRRPISAAGPGPAPSPAANVIETSKTMDTTGAALAEARAADEIDPALLPLLKRVPLLAGLTPQQLRRVVALGRLKRFRAGSAIVRLGARGNSFHVILEGRAFVVRENGRPLRLAAGDFFGELALIDDTPRSADVIAADDVLAFTIGRAGFTRLLRSEAAFTYVILRTLANRLRADQRSPVWQLGNVSGPDPADG